VAAIRATTGPAFRNVPMSRFARPNQAVACASWPVGIVRMIGLVARRELSLKFINGADE
jgi:hypothetical protein